MVADINLLFVNIAYHYLLTCVIWSCDHMTCLLWVAWFHAVTRQLLQLMCVIFVTTLAVLQMLVSYIVSVLCKNDRKQC